MASVRPETADRLHQRVCLACGYRGPEVQPGYPLEMFVCPSCRCDLYARPPRSYAELEAIGAGEAAARVKPEGQTSPQRPAAGIGALARWLGRVMRKLVHWR